MAFWVVRMRSREKEEGRRTDNGENKDRPRIIAKSERIKENGEASIAEKEDI